MDPNPLGEHFDRLTTLHESGNPNSAAGRCRLPLRKTPECRQLPELYRRMDRVDQKLLRAFRRLATGEAPWPLFLHGGVGTGKTLAALSLADFVSESRYWTVEALCDAIMDPEAKTALAWKGVRETRLAILDELGERSKVGDLQYTTVKKYLDLREQRAGRVGIYISNLTPDQLVQMFDRRIVSRLTAGTVVELQGRDRRAAEIGKE